MYLCYSYEVQPVLRIRPQEHWKHNGKRAGRASDRSRRTRRTR